jgi:translation elongation factor EF-1beta
LEKHKHYNALKKTLKTLSESHKKWYSNYGPYASEPSKNLKKDDRKENIFSKDITSSFFTEYIKYYKTDFFLGCSFEVYKKTYNQRLKDYLAEFFDADEINFITDELDEGIYNYKFKEFNSDSFDGDTILSYEKLKKQIHHSLKKRFEFLSHKAKENGFDLVYNEFENSTTEKEKYSLEPIKHSLETKEEVLMNYSDSKLTEKIIALDEMGVLDFLKAKEPFNMSTNRLAEYLSLCLGQKASSIQSYINPIINKSDQTKSPYNTEKTVEKTRQKLIQIGCKID